MKDLTVKLRSEVHVPFILAGKSLIECFSARSGESIVYQITKHKGNKILWFVSVQFRKPPTHDDPLKRVKFAYIGTIFNNRMFCHTRNSKVAPDSRAFRIFQGIWKHLMSMTLPDFIEIKHMGRCGRCGYRLTDPVSQERGFGPHCWEIVKDEVDDPKEEVSHV